MRIPLKNHHGEIVAYALVDDDDQPLIAPHIWALDSHGYVVAKVLHPDGGYYANGRKRRRKIYLHRLILGLEYGDGVESDHRNRDKLDNRRQNLRSTTRLLNSQNKTAYSNSSSHYRGVSWNDRQQCWETYATINYRRHFLGYFSDKEDAVKAVGDWRRQHMPFAELDKLPWWHERSPGYNRLLTALRDLV